jgi:DNA-directed RNA polymerase subunit beta
LLHKEDANLLIMPSFIMLQKDPTNSEKKLLSIFTQPRNAEPPDEETARGIIDNYSSLINVTT